MDLNVLSNLNVLAVLMLCLGASSILLSWDDIWWYVYGSFAFKRWTIKRVDQHRKLVNAGHSKAAATIFIINQVFADYLKSFENPEKGNWNSQRMRAIAKWLELQYDDLLLFAKDESVSKSDRRMALEALDDYSGKQIKAITFVMRHSCEKSITGRNTLLSAMYNNLERYDKQ